MTAIRRQLITFHKSFANSKKGKCLESVGGDLRQVTIVREACNGSFTWLHRKIRETSSWKSNHRREMRNIVMSSWDCCKPWLFLSYKLWFSVGEGKTRATMLKCWLSFYRNILKAAIYWSSRMIMLISCRQLDRITLSKLQFGEPNNLIKRKQINTANVI